METKKENLVEGEIFLPYGRSGSDLRRNFIYSKTGSLDIFKTIRSHQKHILASVEKLDEIIEVVNKYPDAIIDLDGDIFLITISGEKNIIEELIYRDLATKLPYEVEEDEIEDEITIQEKENNDIQRNMNSQNIQRQENLNSEDGGLISKEAENDKEKNNNIVDIKEDNYYDEEEEDEEEEIDLEDYDEFDVIKRGNVYLTYYKQGEDLFQCREENPDGSWDVTKTFRNHQSLLLGSVEHYEEILEVLDQFPDARLNINADSNFIDFWGDKDIMNALFDKELAEEDQNFGEEYRPIVDVEDID
jgi:hypothetical protein